MICIELFNRLLSDIIVRVSEQPEIFGKHLIEIAQLLVADPVPSSS